MSNTKNKNYYGFKQNKQENPYGRYTPGTVGKIAIAVTVPSAIIAFVSVMVALFDTYDSGTYGYIDNIYYIFCGKCNSCNRYSNIQ